MPQRVDMLVGLNGKLPVRNFQSISDFNLRTIQQSLKKSGFNIELKNIDGRKNHNMEWFLVRDSILLNKEFLVPTQDVLCTKELGKIVHSVERDFEQVQEQIQEQAREAAIRIQKKVKSFLEKRAEEAVFSIQYDSAEAIQKIARGSLARTRFQQAREAAIRIQAAQRGHRERSCVFVGPETWEHV